jgi:uncharacterized protein (DUF1330 family)
MGRPTCSSMWGPSAASCPDRTRRIVGHLTGAQAYGPVGAWSSVRLWTTPRNEGDACGCLCHLSGRRPRRRPLRAYTSKAAPNVVAAGGRFVVRGGDIEVLEGDPPPPRASILEFPTREAARAWYFSDDYTGSVSSRKVGLGHGCTSSTGLTDASRSGDRWRVSRPLGEYGSSISPLRYGRCSNEPRLSRRNGG